MIIGIGIDIVDINRIEKTLDKYGKKFKLRCFSKNEIDSSEKKIKPANSYAKKFAAKEALVKALGTGFRDGINFKNIEIKNDKMGKPFVKVSKIINLRIKKKFDVKKFNIFLSICDVTEYAIANIIITK